MKRSAGFLFVFAAVLGAADWFFLKSPARPPATVNSPAGVPSTALPKPPPVGATHEPPISTIHPESVSNTPLPPVTASPPRSPPDDLSAVLTDIDNQAEASSPESLQTLVSYASSENQDIRTDALNGLIRRADPACIPLLRAAAKNTDASRVIIDLLQTADYLALPPLKLGDLPGREKKFPDTPSGRR